MKNFPALVTKLCQCHEGWIIGSAAEKGVDLSSVGDFDILIPFDKWKNAVLLVPKDATPNTFGGWKCISEGKYVDIWPGDLAWLLACSLTRFIWHPKTNTRWVKQ